ncbi:MAG: aminotransferase class V-fold PLP-dependent enzyme [Oscillospiraceae bacterium]
MNSQTPLYAALAAYAAQQPTRFHIPGHKGRPLTLPQGASFPDTALDLTELPPTGNLYVGGDAIAQAEALWASAWGMPHCQFLTGGSTQGLHAAFFAACRPGDRVLIDRACHKAVYTALALVDARPHYLLRNMETPISPSDVENFFATHPKVKTFCMVSPTYYGVLSDIPAIAAAVHAHGGTLVVDAAHGAHLPFLGENPFLGADLVVTSAHKTLPALGQGALLFSGGKFSPEDLRRAAAVTGTSSPSYLVLASLDLARGHMMEQGRGDYEKTIAQVQKLRDFFPSLRGKNLDPARFTLLCDDGFALQEALYAQNIYPEMADKRHVVFVCTESDKPKDFTALAKALQDQSPPLSDPSRQTPDRGARPTPPPKVPAPVVTRTPRAGLFAPKERVPLPAAVGRISAQILAPYPPGVPVLAPGELISKKHLAYLTEIGYNIEDRIEVVL